MANVQTHSIIFIKASVKTNMKLKSFPHSRYDGMIMLSIIFLVISFIVRSTLLIISIKEIDLTLTSLLQIYGVGLFFDLIVLTYFNTAGAFINIFVTDKSLTSKFNRNFSLVQYFIFVFAFVFIAVAEFFFWDEFTSRFNFISVDYLVYTQEVVGNIWQSYPMVWLLCGIAIVSAVLVGATHKIYLNGLSQKTTLIQRIKVFVVMAILSGLSLFVNNSMAQLSPNRVINELSKNGIYSFFCAFRQNTLSYDDFYLTIGPKKAFKMLRKEYSLEDKEDLTPESYSIKRKINGRGPEKKLNVVLIVVESLSAKFLGCFGNDENLTPELDALAEKSLLFTSLYATGTRTTRGLEAVTLSIPPTPGRSVVKRENNNNLFSLGKVFNDKGYESQFLYGGRGFFDNMNSFYAGNGFKILDENNFTKEETTFKNAWGVCDVDLFNKTLKECDKTAAIGRPFFKLLMTTSNHRPYTHSKVIGIPSDHHRSTAVRYTDYAIGDFLKKAKEKPWFKDTVFVIVADHCANSAGKLDIETAKYHIPMFIYCPAHIKAKKIDTLCSQIDLAPTLLGLLNFNYTSEFYGKDVINNPPNRAFIGTYQRLGLYENNRLKVLIPGKKYEIFSVKNNKEMLTSGSVEQKERTISFYQTAGYLNKKNLSKK